MNNIRKIAKEKGMTLNSITVNAELSEGYLQKLLLGKTCPSIRIAWKIAIAMDESIEKVFPRGESL